MNNQKTLSQIAIETLVANIDHDGTFSDFYKDFLYKQKSVSYSNWKIYKKTKGKYLYLNHKGGKK